MASFLHVPCVRRLFSGFASFALLCTVACLLDVGIVSGGPVSAETSDRRPVPEQLWEGWFQRMDERARTDFLEAKKQRTQVVELPGKTSSFAYWFPPNFEEMPEKRVMVLIHGHTGNPFRQILRMQNAAGEYGFGLLALPWEWPLGNGKEYRQVRPEMLYVAITRALDHMEARHRVDKRRSAWLGFGKAAQLCAQIAYLDRNVDRSYFELFIAVSGNLGRRAPFMKKLLDGAYGSKPLAGKRFYLWCGETDERVLCPGVEQSEAMLKRAGATVVRTRKGSEGHAGFYTNPVYIKEAVRYWRQPKS